MTQKDQALHINIADPEDIQAKLGEVRERIAAKKREVQEAHRELRVWQDVLRRLELLAGLEPEAARKLPPTRAGNAVPRALQSALLRSTEGQDPGTQDAVVQVLEQVGQPLRNSEVASRLPHINPRTVSWALWNAERAGRIRRLQQGIYAPNGYWDPDSLPLPGASSDED